MPSYIVKAGIRDPRAKALVFARMKTMYGGKMIAAGDAVFLFASEGGQGLVARGVVTKAEAAKKPRGLERWTPRVSIEVKRTALAKRTLGRDQLKAWRDLKDGSPQAELDFKFYRQATNKICAVSDATAAFLRSCF